MHTVALKGSSYLRKMEVTTLDSLNGYVRKNGKTIPVRRKGVLDEWYQDGLQMAVVDTMFKSGRYI